MNLDENSVRGVFEKSTPSRARLAMETLQAFEHASMANESPPALNLGKDASALDSLIFEGMIEPDASLLSRAIFGGMAIGEDLGEGPARYLWAEEVRATSKALDALTEAELRLGFDTSAMVWSQDRWFDEDVDDENLILGLLSDLKLLATYYRIAATRGNAMLIGWV